MINKRYNNRDSYRDCDDYSNYNHNQNREHRDPFSTRSRSAQNNEAFRRSFRQNNRYDTHRSYRDDNDAKPSFTATILAFLNGTSIKKSKKKIREDLSEETTQMEFNDARVLADANYKTLLFESSGVLWEKIFFVLSVLF